MMEKTLICPRLSFEEDDNNIDSVSESERIKEKLRYLFDQFTSSNIVFRYWNYKKEMSTTRLYFSLLFLPLVSYNFFSRGRLRCFCATVKPCKPNKQLLIAKTNKTWFSLHLGQIYKFTHAKEFQTRRSKNCFKHELTVSLYTAMRKGSAHVRAKKHTKEQKKNKITSGSR